MKNPHNLQKGLEQVESSLIAGVIPLESNTSTIIDKYIRAQDSNSQAANLLIQYGVKKVMADVNINTHVEVVKNARAGLDGHDNNAMKLSFKSPEEARAFSKKLFNDSGYTA